MKRREFIPRAIVGSSIIAAVPLLATSCEEEDPVTPDDNNGKDPVDNNNNSNTGIQIDLTESFFAALKNAGGSAINGDIIIINVDGTEFVAMSKICTHNGCTVDYDDNSNKLECPCHGSEFSTSGSVLKGPASSPLETYMVTRDGDILTIK